ncbi:MAG: class I tRNA ligase family protein, partial [Acidimicrobiales bacterium]
KRARARIVELLGASGDLLGEPRPISHVVKFYERGERPLEIVSSKQWFVRSLELRGALQARGRELEWHPPFMQGRFQSWVDGLSSDWNISRQRFFGVPFPIWYRVGEDGEAIEGAFVLAEEGELPVDPSTDVPEGFEASERNRPGGFCGDPDVMDTWATSSLTPQIAGGWLDDPEQFARVFPMDLRPQGHDIIRTWLFSSVVRSELEHHELPWAHTAISGWILDPDRKKMSKSKGNVAVPIEPIEQFGTDAVRYWALSARLGVDTAYDTQQMQVGRRLAIKILNVSRFVLSLAEPGGPTAEPGAGGPRGVFEPVDSALLGRLSDLIGATTACFESYEHARALELCETFFWSFCDDYVELVKARAYGGSSELATASARSCLVVTLSVLLRLFAPFLPYCTEEAWSWSHDGSIHLEAWPGPGELGGPGARASLEPGLHGALLETVYEVLAALRRAKSERHLSMRAPVARLSVRGPDDKIALLEQAKGDLMDAGTIAEAELSPGEGAELAIEVEI